MSSAPTQSGFCEEEGYCPHGEAHEALRKVIRVFGISDLQGGEPEILRALECLKRLGRSDYLQRSRGATQARCDRFVRLAWYQMSKAPATFWEKYEGFWEAYGNIVFHAVECIQANQGALSWQVNAVLATFSDKFAREASKWSARSHIVAGLAAAVPEGHVHDGNVNLWRVLEYFLAYCEAAVSCIRGEIPKSIRECIHNLTVLWEKLAETGGQTFLMRHSVAEVSLPLLLLIERLTPSTSGSFSFWSGFASWRRMILNLRLNEMPEQQWYHVSSTFAKVSQRLNDLHTLLSNLSDRTRYEVTQRDLMAALRRDWPQGDRRVIRVPGLRRIKITIGGKTVEADVLNVCGRSYTGFALEVPEYVLEGEYQFNDESVVDDKVDGRFVRRRVRMRHISEQDLSEVERVTVRPRYPAQQPADSFELQCCILRAWRLADARKKTGAGLAILASQREYVPEEWKDFVRSLDKQRPDGRQAPKGE